MTRISYQTTKSNLYQIVTQDCKEKMEQTLYTTNFVNESTPIYLGPLKTKA